MNRVGLTSVALLLAGCVTTRQALLSPANGAARAAGPLHAKLVGGRHGQITLALPDGGMLSGSYTVALRSKAGLGTQYDHAAGNGGPMSGAAFGASAMISAFAPGAADLTNPTGARAHCDFVANILTGHGKGACQLSTGGLYRMEY